MSLPFPDDAPALKRPLVVEVAGEAADPAGQPPVPEPAAGQAMQRVARLTTLRRSAFQRFALAVFSSLFALVLSVAAWNFVAGLFAANGILGWLAFGLMVLALVVVLVLVVKELASLSRMARLDRLRAEAGLAAAAGDMAAARRVTGKLLALYHGRADLAWAAARLDERRAEVLDADALLALAETELMAPLDRAALAEIEAAARQVATVTAFVPLALADVVTALYANLRLIRRLSQIYGGRAGTFGSLRLLRRVFQALLGAGALALADDLIGSVASGGLLAKLSRRFGEGFVNGALTVRVGLAAMEVSRPLPFAALPRPATTATTTRALAGFFTRAEAEGQDRP